MSADGSTGLLAGRYRLGEVIGRGGLSTVFAGEDMAGRDPRGRPREVALKVMRSHAASPDFARLLHLEARRLVDLAHPNIVRVFAADSHGPFEVMVMERLHGVTLSAVVNAEGFSGLPLPLAFALVRAVGAGLDHAHGRGLVHADLKPGNVFLTRDGGVKLLDFGSAQALADAMVRGGDDDSEIAVERVGAVTPAYASPERLTGAQVSEADDVFSLAIIAHLLMSGQHPFARKTALAARDELMEPLPVAGLSRRRWRMLRAGLSFEASERPASIAAFVHGVARPGPIDRWLG